MSETSLRDRLRDGDTVIGTFQLIDSPTVTEVAGLAALDFVVIDQEHGPLTAETSSRLCMAADAGKVDPVIRVRENSPPEIQRALDIGASAVQIPQIETREHAESAVRAAKFDPIGERGLSPYVRAGEYQGGDSYTENQNEETAVIVHIEGERGVENLDEIMTVNGLDVLFLGPYDLSQSLGIPGEVRDERVEDLMATVSERAIANGVTVGTYADDIDMAQRWLDIGIQYITISVDATLVRDTFASLSEITDK